MPPTGMTPRLRPPVSLPTPLSTTMGMNTLAPPIERWMLQASEVQPQVNVTRACVDGETAHVVGIVEGNFPGSPVELEFVFNLQNGKIAQLTIS